MFHSRERSRYLSFHGLTVFLLLGVGLMAHGSATLDRDPHSFSNPDQIRVSHLELKLGVDFSRKVLVGEAIWNLERQPGSPAEAALVLDTRGLSIIEVAAAHGDSRWEKTAFKLGPADPILGVPLSITLPAEASRVRIRYETSPSASALQWVEPGGTAGKKYPFLFTQSQAIHARSWIPCQDTPAVRVTYRASVSVKGDANTAAFPLRVVMAAELRKSADAAVSEFEMTRAIPSYLIALAVGELVFKPLGDRTGIWAEPSVVEKAAWEFADTEKMVQAAEAAFGPYRWGRYDILVLPPSFPYGGMENPLLTFATPTVLAGDRSQVALIAHELAHSWSGNLVTNATWADFWLNEGFTVYLERRIVESVIGRDRVEMEQVLGEGDLKEGLATLPPSDQILHINLKERDPDEGVTRIPYEKGALFLEALARKVGREKLRQFLAGYFDHFAFRSITTAEFEAYLRETLFPGVEVPVDLQAWLHEPGLPPHAPHFESPRFEKIIKSAQDWLDGAPLPSADETRDWSTLEWLQFLRSMPKDLSSERLARLDQSYGFTKTGNAEVACQWFQMAIRAGYPPAVEPLESYLRTVGRRKFVVPLYKALIQSPEGRERARRIFEQARDGYHPIAVESITKILSAKGVAE